MVLPKVIFYLPQDGCVYAFLPLAYKYTHAHICIYIYIYTYIYVNYKGP